MLIDEMPAGREMDNLVAEKVMGLVHSCDGDPKAIGCPYNVLPMYSTNIAAAWDVMEKMSLMVVPIKSVEWDRDPYDDGRGDLPRGWAASRCSASESRDTYFEVSTRGWTFAETAPLAICRAALKAVSK